MVQICSKCRKECIPEVEYAGKKYCRQHFLELMEKRVRKNLRVRELIDVKKNYFLIDDGSSEAKLTEYFLNRIFEGHLKLRIGSVPKRSDTNIIVPSNLDEQALVFLDTFLKNKKEKTAQRKIKKVGAKKSAADRTQIIPLEVLMQKEVKLLCEITGIKFAPRIKENMLDDLEKRYPGTKFSLFQSRMNLIDIERK